MKSRRVRMSIAALVLTSLSIGQGPKNATPEDLKSWEVLSERSISADGRWISFRVARVDSDGTLIIKNSDGPIIASIQNAARPAFSDDSKWCAYLLGPSKAIAEQLRAEKKPLETKLGLRNLATNTELILEGITGFDFLKGGRFLIAHRGRPPGRTEGGSDFVVMDLSNGNQISIGNATATFANESENLIAIATSSESGEKTLELYNPAQRTLVPLYWGKGDVVQVDWAKNQDTLAFMVSFPDEEHDSPANKVFVALNGSSGVPKLRAFSADTVAGFPAGKRISETAPMQMNDNATSVAFGLQDWRPKPKSGKKPEDQTSVEIWNTHDLRVQPLQKFSAGMDRAKTSVCVWHLDVDSFRQIGDGVAQTVSLEPGFEHAILSDPIPYQSAVSNGVEYSDKWLVDTKTGERTRIATKNQWPSHGSRTGRYLTYFEAHNWWLYDTKDNTRRSLTGDVKVPFDDLKDDHAIAEKPPVAEPIWLKGDDGVLLTDEFDVWLARMGTSSITDLTHGRKDREEFRFVDPNPSDESDGPSIQKPFYFHLVDQDNKATGYYQCDSLGKGKTLIEQESNIDGMVKSKDTDRVLFQIESFEQSTNLFLSNLTFTAIKPESKTNPQQKNLKWGKSELVQYKSRFGVPLEGVLIYPADYVAGRNYPMVTLVYERESDTLHQYVVPVDQDPYNVQILSQNGYFVFKPDIAYQPRNPGKSAVDCLEPALNAVFAKRVGVDPNKVGLIGHSWGGYETAFVTTVSKAFAVGVAGAPITELTSMYNSFYWNRGISQQPLMETQQGRMGVPFWEDPKAYIENSPVWQSMKRTAPLLIEDGDQDGAVPWQQAQYLYQTLRRMGKNAVLLVYEGENHGLTKRANELDYAHRLRHFLDVYLKNAKPEPWVTEGVPFLKRDQ